MSFIFHRSLESTIILVDLANGVCRILQFPGKFDFINSDEICFPGISLRCLSKFIVVAKSDPTMIGITFALVFHSSCISILRS